MTNATLDFCPSSGHRKHYWKKDNKLCRRLGKSDIIVFVCSFCQTIKTKVLSYIDAGDGKIKTVIKEILPEGQMVPEYYKQQIETEVANFNGMETK